MTETMLAERFYAQDRSIHLEEVPVPHPGPGNVLVEVAYCGICHSDLSLINGTFPAQLPVVTQGHEASGTVVELGAGVTGWKVGDRVIPSAGRPCLNCRKCRRGDFANCLHLNLMAFAYDGAWAKYHEAAATGLTKIPDNVPMDQAALLADAVSTPYAAVVHTAQVHMGNAVAVWGVGGVGTHLVQLAKAAGGVPVIAIDLNDEVLARAKRVGADHILRSDDPDLMARIEELTNGRMIDVAFDAVGIRPTLRAAVDSLDVNGKAVSLGLSSQSIDAGPFMNFNLERKRVMGHLGYHGQDIAMLAEMLSYHRLDLSESISEVVPLDEVQRGIEDLEQHRNNPIRILVRP
ncbi:zinc-binding dehydrogenase [Acidipropionibacterium virtanenii]|uniref:Alcohol dehydrogenase n=1 Tax=Acidipropionibacterium virtanenii TaxID=2057246 RepID=A0A344UWU0_9ACTN|nr:zinc-binding dehydrogenase [Acidipropionibacterium virtanenii]AXE39738.1 Alcohol dehydrogenase [Acidipropionibacterium virtanenii]